MRPMATEIARGSGFAPWRTGFAGGGGRVVSGWDEEEARGVELDLLGLLKERGKWRESRPDGDGGGMAENRRGRGEVRWWVDGGDTEAGQGRRKREERKKRDDGAVEERLCRAKPSISTRDPRERERERGWFCEQVSCCSLLFRRLGTLREFVWKK